MTDTEPPSKRKTKSRTSFSNVTQTQAESILGFRFMEFYKSQIPLTQFITTTAPGQLKKEIFKRLIDCIESEGYPEAIIWPMNETVVTDNVEIILQAIVSHCRRNMNRPEFRLIREKQIISKDEKFGGYMDFVNIQMITFENIRDVLVIEAKRDSLGKGLKQLLLALKSMCDMNDDQKLVYGFVTTGIVWQLVTYDGQTWKLSKPSTLLDADMAENEDEWLNNNTQILDAIYSILLSI
jgi:hypothetical protein